MAETYIYDQDCDDFATLGLCGRLDEMVCTFEEEANGMSELTLEHPIDPEGRFALLLPGRILKATVPVRNIPELDEETLDYAKSVQTWYVRKDASKIERSIYNKRDDQIAAEREAAQEANRLAREDRKRRKDAGEDVSGEAEKDIDVDKIKKKRLKLLKKGAKVTVTKDWGELYPEVRVKVGKVTGYIVREALDDRTSETHTYTPQSYANIYDFMEKVEPTWTAKEQLFRIYSVQRQDDRVIVQARHIFYDNAYALTTYDATGNVSLSTVLKGIRNNRIGSCETVFHTNIKGSRTAAHYTDKNLVEALLDPEEGIAARWGANVIRDNYDCYLIDEAGFDRGVCLEYGHDLLGVDYEENWENIITCVRPVGETASGKPLYLTGYKGLVESSRADRYPYRRIALLEVSEAHVKKGELTTAEAWAKMKAAAKELLASGVDQPEVSVHVTFQQLGDTVEYAAYKGLKNLFLFDSVRVRNNRLGVDVRASVTRIVWNCRLQRMVEVDLGSLHDISTKVPGYQLASGINGRKISPGSITSAGLDDECVNVRHMQADSVNADAIQAESITSRHIVTGAIMAEHLAAGAAHVQALEAVIAAIRSLSATEIHVGTLETDTLAAAFAHLTELVAEDIRAGTVQANTLSAVTADIVSTAMATLDVDYARVRDLDADEAIITDGEARSLYIDRLAVTSANLLNAVIGRLVLTGDDGSYYAVHIGSGGGIGLEEVTIDESEIAAGQTADGRNIVTDAINAESLSGRSVHAESAILGTVLTHALSAGQITATEATLASAAIPELRTTAISALGSELLLSASEAVRVFIGNAENYNTTFSFGSDGLRTRIRRADGSYSKWSTLVTPDGYYIDHADVPGHVGAFHEDLFEPRSIRMGGLTCRETSAGGWVWNVNPGT